MGAKSGSTSKNAMFTALDNGVNHFDIARSYGYGEAEKFVGKLLKSQRDNIVLASKFGIRATPLATLIRPLKPLLRSIKGETTHVSNNNSTENQPANSRDLFHRRIPINVPEMKKSLDESLKKLQTDHLDYFFVHEPFAAIENSDEIFAEAIRLKESGKIKAFGLASDMELLHLHAKYLSYFDLLQFNFNRAKSNREIELTRKEMPNILFSPLRNALANSSPKEAFDALQTRFPKSIFLCSMFNPEHIRQNCAIFK